MTQIELIFTDFLCQLNNYKYCKLIFNNYNDKVLNFVIF